MSSEIVNGDQLRAQPVPWRVVKSTVVSGGRTGSKAEHESASRLDQMRREAFLEGIAAGRQQAEEQIRPAMDNLAQVLADLAKLKESIRERTTEDLVHLAVTIAGRVIHREIVVDPEALAGLVKAAFTKVQSREINRVRMHPVLEPLVRKSLEQCGAPKNLVLVPDAALQSGELLFETSQGMLDASVETQLREIERGLVDKLDK